MQIFLNNKNLLTWPGHSCSAVIGAGGLIDVALKREGDGATPIGKFALRRVLYRMDRVKRPETSLPCRALRADDGWCDAPGAKAYNRPVRLPYPAATESLFREDHVYDILVVLAHNDAPPTGRSGSAIFIHLARKSRIPTRGCIALTEIDLRALLKQAGPNSVLWSHVQS